MINIAKRNIRLFFRDKTSVFFSSLSVIIIMSLYVLFLGDMMSNWEGGVTGVRFLMDSWIVAGLVAASSVTSTLGALGVIVEDYSKNIVKDFYSSPIKKSTLIGGYLISSFVIGTIMSCLALVFGELYIIINGGELLSLFDLLKVFGVIVLSTFANSAILFLVISFIRTQNAFSTLSIIIGTIIGFLMGIYVPVGALPDFIQKLMKVFPGTYSVALFRTIIMKEPMGEVFAQAPEAEMSRFALEMGVVIKIGNWQVTPLFAIMFLVVMGILFYGISILRLRTKKS
ncbi:MAG TPA: ABC transporter permease [Bacilli bacterium]|nr:MAG: ABC-2 family transporter protein [Tenericutes bacterium ADurb.BinA124]HNZ50883.1 ABC transporter permease [Bacilli bacterium]HPN61052.1 ABC transporter permease [Bacilli bacterium]HPX83858.1 ABC transporter permease [Bacilli bacterium]HQC74850.1 ABC transporter permease [Bacilli bacterium]